MAGGGKRESERRQEEAGGLPGAGRQPLLCGSDAKRAAHRQCLGRLVVEKERLVASTSCGEYKRQAGCRLHVASFIRTSASELPPAGIGRGNRNEKLNGQHYLETVSSS